MDRLKPCPWCGKTPSILQWGVTNELYIACTNKRCAIRPETGLRGLKNIEAHINAWNRREALGGDGNG